MSSGPEVSRNDQTFQGFGITCGPERKNLRNHGNHDSGLISSSDLTRQFMSTLAASRKAIAAGKHPTLATVLAHVLADPALTLRQRQDRASAIRTVTKALGRPPDEMSADIRELRAGLKGFAPAMTGLSERRWCNALSLLRRAIASAGISLIPVRS
ncbi:MAG: hypothetical protein JO264_07890, partial [Acidisphaera sp.]|nr:hypothetical protein [Acidisphaera sp.]